MCLTVLVDLSEYTRDPTKARGASDRTAGLQSQRRSCHCISTVKSRAKGGLMWNHKSSVWWTLKQTLSSFCQQLETEMCLGEESFLGHLQIDIFCVWCFLLLEQTRVETNAIRLVFFHVEWGFYLEPDHFVYANSCLHLFSVHLFVLFWMCLYLLTE